MRTFDVNFTTDNRPLSQWRRERGAVLCEDSMNGAWNIWFLKRAWVAQR